MGNFRNKNVYQALGVQQSINAVGTGTAVVEAINNDRNGVGIELEFAEITKSN